MLTFFRSLFKDAPESERECIKKHDKPEKLRLDQNIEKPMCFWQYLKTYKGIDIKWHLFRYLHLKYRVI